MRQNLSRRRNIVATWTLGMGMYHCTFLKLLLHNLMAHTSGSGEGQTSGQTGQTYPPLCNYWSYHEWILLITVTILFRRRKYDVTSLFSPPAECNSVIYNYLYLLKANKTIATSTFKNSHRFLRLFVGIDFCWKKDYCKTNVGSHILRL